MNKATPLPNEVWDGDVCSVSLHPGTTVPAPTASVSPSSTDEITSIISTDARMVLGFDGLVDATGLTARTLSVSSSSPPKSISPKTRRSRPLTAEQESFIGAKASRLCRMCPFNCDDKADVAQELRKAWLAVRDRFNPNRGSARAYFKTVIERSAGKLRDHNFARMRMPHPVDAPDPIQTLTPRQRSEELARNRRRALTRPSSLTHEDCVQLKIDVPELVKQLPEPLAQLCEKLKELSLAEISRESGVAESTLSSRVGRIRKCFERLSLRDFL